MGTLRSAGEGSQVWGPSEATSHGNENISLVGSAATDVAGKHGRICLECSKVPISVRFPSCPHQASADTSLPLQMPHVGFVTWVLPQYPVLSPTAPVALGLEFVFSPRLHAAWQGHGVCCTVRESLGSGAPNVCGGRGKKRKEVTVDTECSPRLQAHPTSCPSTRVFLLLLHPHLLCGSLLTSIPIHLVIARALYFLL